MAMLSTGGRADLLFGGRCVVAPTRETFVSVIAEHVFALWDTEKERRLFLARGFVSPRDVIAWIFDDNARGDCRHAPAINDLGEVPGFSYSAISQTCKNAMGCNAHVENAVCSTLRDGAYGQGKQSAVSEPAWAREIRGKLRKENTF